ncbi:hypothetical protein [Actinomadura pelletieri]|nr:hypothetical protein [Actinomadura pelletieri]
MSRSVAHSSPTVNLSSQIGDRPSSAALNLQTYARVHGRLQRT